MNESPAGQVTVTSVVKDLALGSSLDLAADPGSVSPAASNYSHSWLARPAREAAHRQIRAARRAERPNLRAAIDDRRGVADRPERRFAQVKRSH